MLTLAMSAQERLELARLFTLREAEEELLRLYSAYLNHDARFITPELIRSLTTECGSTEEEAFLALLDAAFGLDERKNGDLISRRLLTRSVRRLDAEVYRRDPYFSHIRVPHKRVGTVELAEEVYAPYEGFICGPLLADDFGFAELPPLGYFAEEVRFPALKADGQEWMAIKPSEIETMRAPIAAAKGRVLTLGLGLGYFAFMAAQKENVSRVTVVERDPLTLRLFRDELLPQFPQSEKLELVEEDAFAYLQTSSAAAHDFVFADLWHDVGDGFDLYLALRRAEEKLAPARPFAYWVEDFLLSHLRGLLVAELSAAAGREPPRPPLRPTVSSMREVLDLLSPAHLRALAPSLKRAEE